MGRKTLTNEEMNELRSNISIAIESVIFGQAKKFGFSDYKSILSNEQVEFCIDTTTQLLGTKIFNKKKYTAAKKAKQAKKERLQEASK